MLPPSLSLTRLNGALLWKLNGLLQRGRCLAIIVSLLYVLVRLPPHWMLGLALGRLLSAVARLLAMRLALTRREISLDMSHRIGRGGSTTNALFGLFSGSSMTYNLAEGLSSFLICFGRIAS